MNTSWPSQAYFRCFWLLVNKWKVDIYIWLLYWLLWLLFSSDLGIVRDTRKVLKVHWLESLWGWQDVEIQQLSDQTLACTQREHVQLTRFLTWQKPMYFVLFFVYTVPFPLCFIPWILPTTPRFLTLFFRSYFYFVGPFNCISLYESLPQPWYNSSRLTGLKAPTN